MTRKEFLKICGILGIGIPAQEILSACKTEELIPGNFKGKVVIIGAGAGGLSAGYFLKQQGIDFEILEASIIPGGRIRINTDFADFPIPLGAEWIETKTSIFSEIVNDSSVKSDIKTVSDSPDYKFVNYSWYNFFDDYIIPSVADKITYNSQVKSVDYTGEQISIKTINKEYKADKVVVSVPLKILKAGDINFIPAFPKDKLDAIKSSEIWDGFKAFFEFSEQFYEDEFETNIYDANDGQKIYYDATLGQQSSQNIIGLFTVGKPAGDFISHSESSLKEIILKELDGMFSNKATPNYKKHITQNWNKEPFIRGGYMSDYADWKTVKKLSESLRDKIYFAGGAYTDGEDWVSVHTASRSAKAAISEILKLS